MERPTSGSRTIKSMLEAQERQKPRHSPHTPDGFAGHLPEAPHGVSGIHLNTRRKRPVFRIIAAGGKLKLHSDFILYGSLAAGAEFAKAKTERVDGLLQHLPAG